jgi:hypothetical protein
MVSSQAEKSEQDDRYSLIAPPQIGVAFELRLSLNKAPSSFVSIRPGFSKNAASDLTRLHQLLQASLHGNPDISPRAAGTVTVDQFQKGVFLLASKVYFPVQALQGLGD